MVNVDSTAPYSTYLNNQQLDSQGLLGSQGQADLYSKLNHASKLGNPQTKPGPPQVKLSYLNLGPDVSPKPKLPQSSSGNPKSKKGPSHLANSQLHTTVSTPIPIQIKSSIAKNVPLALTSNHKGETHNRFKAHIQLYNPTPLAPLDKLKFNP